LTVENNQVYNNEPEAKFKRKGVIDTCRVKDVLVQENSAYKTAEGQCCYYKIGLISKLVGKIIRILSLG
jgi:hypothetical protein